MIIILEMRDDLNYSDAENQKVALQKNDKSKAKKKARKAEMRASKEKASQVTKQALICFF